MTDFTIIKIGDVYGLLPLNDTALNWLIRHGAVLAKFDPDGLASIVASIRSDGLTITS
jgi:hypothetical protein